MVAPDLHLVGTTFKIMSPVFETAHNREHLPIVDIIILLDLIKTFGNKSTGVPFTIGFLHAKNATSGITRSISFNSEGFGRIGVMEDRFRGEPGLQIFKCSLLL